MDFNFDEKAEQDLLNRVTLRFTKKLAKRPSDSIEASLAKGYKKQKNALSLMELAVLHAAYLQKRIYCTITRDACVELAQNNENAKFSLNKNDNSYKTLIYNITERDKLFRLEQAGVGRSPAIYELIHPELRKVLLDAGVDPSSQLAECQTFVKKKTTNKKKSRADEKDEAGEPENNRVEISKSERFENFSEMFDDLISKVTGKYWKTLPEEVVNALIHHSSPLFEYLLYDPGPFGAKRLYEAALEKFLNDIFSPESKKQAFKRGGEIHKKLKGALINAYAKAEEARLLQLSELIDAHRLSIFSGMVMYLKMRDQVLSAFGIPNSPGLSLQAVLMKTFSHRKNAQSPMLTRNFFEQRCKINAIFVKRIHKENPDVIFDGSMDHIDEEDYYIFAAKAACLEDGFETPEYKIWDDWVEANPKHNILNENYESSPDKTISEFSNYLEHLSEVKYCRE